MSIQFRVLFTPGRALAILRAQRFAAHVRKGQRRATHPAAKTAAHPAAPLAAAQPVAPAPCPSVLPSEAAEQPSPNQIKHRLRQQGHTLKSWAAANGFKYRTVSDVVRGLRQGNYGEGREVRQRLGLPVTD